MSPMSAKRRRRFIPSGEQSRYLGLLKKLGGESLAQHGRAVLSKLRARRPITGVAGDQQPTDPPKDILARAACIERCRKRGSERAVAECIAGCMGLVPNDCAKPAPGP